MIAPPVPSHLQCLLKVLCICSLLVITAADLDIAAYSCKARPSWKTTSADNTHAQELFQLFLLAFQTDLSKCAHPETTVYSAGIGASLSIAVLQFMTALSRGTVYSPSDEWIWAAHENLTCHESHRRSLDCFFQKFSLCTPHAAHVRLGINDTHVCSLAAMFQKPLVWIYGQLVHYMLRLPPHASFMVNRRLHHLYRSIPSVPVTGTIAMHVRSGKVRETLHVSREKVLLTRLCASQLDAGRSEVPVAMYMKYLNQIANHLKDTGRHVHTGEGPCSLVDWVHSVQRIVGVCS